MVDHDTVRVVEKSKVATSVILSLRIRISRRLSGSHTKAVSPAATTLQALRT
jgi:hypothetical protein